MAPGRPGQRFSDPGQSKSTFTSASAYQAQASVAKLPIPLTFLTSTRQTILPPIHALSSPTLASQSPTLHRRSKSSSEARPSLSIQTYLKQRSLSSQYNHTSPPSTMSSTSKSSSSSSRTPTKRLLTELSVFASSPPSPFILSLQPSPSSLLTLHAILSGHTLPLSSGYTTGRWLLRITIPANYPNSPPAITFVTKICHANVDFSSGEVCLDVLKENWTPVLGVVGALESVGRLLGEPGPDSPLGVEVGALLRAGDVVGARGLVGYWCGEERWEGGLDRLEGYEGERESRRERERERR